MRLRANRSIAIAVAICMTHALFAQEVAPAVFPAAVPPAADTTLAQPAAVPAMAQPAAEAQSPQVAPNARSQRRPAHALRISSGDLLEVGVFDTPELSGKLRVDANGDIVVPVAGTVRVAGLTAEAAAVAVEDKLRSTDIMKHPHVSVFIAEYATQGVTVTGEVRSPGIYPLLGSHGLVDLLSAAGGTTPTAGRVLSITHKSDPDHPEMLRFDTRPGKIAQDIDILPGDTIVVARAGVAYVVGDVNHPGGFLIEGNDRLTVLQVLALASGTGKTAAPDKARLIRKTVNGREEMPIPLKKMMSGKVIDIPVEDGDILYVPSSRGKIYGARGLDSILALTSGLVVAGRL